MPVAPTQYVGPWSVFERRRELTDAVLMAVPTSVQSGVTSGSIDTGIEGMLVFDGVFVYRIIRRKLSHVVLWTKG